MNQIEISYLAGFFDGEGCIGFYRRKNGRDSLVVTVGGTDEWSIRRYLQLGGSVHGPYAPRIGKFGHQNKMLWQWRVTGKKAQPILRTLAPHLGLKRSQAEIALSLAIGSGSKRITESERLLREGAREKLVFLKRGA